LCVFLRSGRDGREAREQNRCVDDLAAVEAAIYDQSFRALDEQARVLDALRARAGALAAGASVATAVLGGLAGASHSALDARLHPASSTATGLFVGVLLLSLFVVAPRRNTALSHHPHQLIRTYLNREPPASLAEYRRAIAFYNGRNFDKNARQVRVMGAAFAVASVCLGCELVVWLWVLAS
jgi:hypothetical protein